MLIILPRINIKLTIKIDIATTNAISLKFNTNKDIVIIISVIRIILVLLLYIILSSLSKGLLRSSTGAINQIIIPPTSVKPKIITSISGIICTPNNTTKIRTIENK